MVEVLQKQTMTKLSVSTRKNFKVKITNIQLSIIPDSRAQNTLEATFFLDNFQVTASVPAGKSKGKFETVSLAPNLAIAKFTQIKSQILETDFSTITEFDNFLKQLDGTENKSNLGGNLILVLSIAFTKLLAKSQNLQTYQLISQITGKNPQKFPYLYFNLIGGGLHAKNSLPFQEYCLVTKFNSPMKDLAFAQDSMEKLKQYIQRHFQDVRQGDEGAFVINSDDPEVGLEVLQQNLSDDNINFALDVAASSFFIDGQYKIGEELLTTTEMLSLYQNLVKKYPLISIEDPFAEEDDQGFIKITQSLKDQIWIIADDFTVTNPNLIKKVEQQKAATGIIIKPNQIGSVSETLAAIKLAESYGWKIIISHRSGETYDDFIADLAYGIAADGLKSGAPTQPQRLVKYQRLIEIEKAEV